MTGLPEATRRLFPSHSADSLTREESRPFLVGRLLEEGDREDLRWLASEVDEHELRFWIAERGSRQLSRRSLAFWWRLLGFGGKETARGDTERNRTTDEELWPL